MAAFPVKKVNANSILKGKIFKIYKEYKSFQGLENVYASAKFIYTYMCYKFRKLLEEYRVS